MKNVGGMDRKLRIVLGAAAIGVGIFAPLRLKWRVSAVSLGVSQLKSAFSGYCALNESLGINTHHVRTLSPTAERDLMRMERMMA